MKKLETYIYITIIAILNLPLLFGKFPASMIFVPEKIMAGQIWRLLTHPFVHVSWYHLLLDATAFIILYNQLSENITRRTLYVIGCGLISLIAVIPVLPNLNSTGYCGLSGIAHGLMTIISLDLITNKQTRNIGLVTTALITGKCIFEAATGQMFFNFIHSNLIGCPIAMAHVGGAIGGLAIFTIFNFTAISTSLKSKKIVY